LLQQPGYPIAKAYKAMFFPMARIILALGKRSGAVCESTAIKIPA